MHKPFATFIWSLLLWSSTAFGGGQLEVKKTKANVYKTAAKKNTIKTLPRSTVVEKISRKGMSWEIKTADGIIGWMSIMDVKPVRASKKDGFGASLRRAVQKERKENDSANMRVRSQVMGVRGLDESDEVAFAGNAKPNFRLVSLMEEQLVTDQEISQQSDLITEEIANLSR